MAFLRETGLVALALIASSGCEAFDESLLDGGADAGPACPLHRPPARPRAPDGDDGETYFYALRDLAIDQRMDRWTMIGFDLDGLCSLDPDPMVECVPPTSTAPREIDGEGGIDNALGHNFIPLFLIAMPGLEGELRMYQSRGIGVALLQITGWNGEDDDARVDAVLTESGFGTPDPPDHIDSWGISTGALQVNGEDWPMPLWDGNDTWYAGDENFLAGDPTRPLTLDSNAYVADRTLVMRVLDRFPVVFSGDRRASQFLLTDATFVAKIADDDATVEYAILSGRFGKNDLLATIPTAGACPGTMDYTSVERLANAGADVRSSPGTGGPGIPCDAVSVGLRWDRGSRATFGGVVDGLPLPNPCTPEMDGGVPADGGMLDGGVDGGT